MKVASKKEEPLCSRTLVTVEDDSPVTPSNADVAKFIAEKEGCEQSLVVMDGMVSGYGKHTTTAKAYVYKDAKSKARFQETTKHMKEQAKKAAEEAAKAAEEAKKAEEEAKKAEEEAKATEAAKPEEKPAEEAKPEEKAEEKPAEEKKEGA